MAINGKSNIAHDQNSPPWKIIFSFAVWNIWKNRNHFVFKGQSQNPSLAKIITNHPLEFFFCARPINVLRTRVTNLVKWDRLKIGWMMLNTNGPSLGNPGIAGGGGVIWDQSRRWVIGFSRKIGIATSLLVELWAIRDGLMLCTKRNLAMVEVELDAKAVVDMLANSQYLNNVISPLIVDSRHLVSQIPQVRFKHSYRETNKCADKLARKGANQTLNLIFYENLPVDLCEFVEVDLNGVSLARQCPGNFVIPQFFLYCIHLTKKKKKRR